MISTMVFVCVTCSLFLIYLFDNSIVVHVTTIIPMCTFCHRICLTSQKNLRPHLNVSVLNLHLSQKAHEKMIYISQRNTWNWKDAFIELWKYYETKIRSPNRASEETMKENRTILRSCVFHFYFCELQVLQIPSAREWFIMCYDISIVSIFLRISCTYRQRWNSSWPESSTYLTFLASLIVTSLMIVLLRIVSTKNDILSSLRL